MKERAQIHLVSLLFLVELALAAGCGGSSPESDPSARPESLPNIVLIIVDTLRADNLGCYGFSEEISPEIDR